LTLFVGPLLQYLGASQPLMSCCKRNSKHACCKRKAAAKAGKPTFEAAPPCGTSCAKCCQTAPSFAPVVLAPSIQAFARVSEATPLRIAGTGRLRSLPRPNSLFQRPPPAFLSL
jgi:hypothetical protein